MEDRILDLEALLKVPYVSPDYGFDVSPDGKQVAFSWNVTGRWEIYSLPLEQSAAPRQLTSGPGAKFAPRWSPDGDRLAYVVDLDGGELFDIHLLELASGRQSNLTPDTPDAIQPNFCWSPDGSQIAFCSDRAGRFDTYVMDLEGGSLRRALALARPDWRVLWSPDGEWLAVVTEGAGQDHWTFIVPVAGGETRPVAVDGEPVPASDACWSPDSSRLAFASHRNGLFCLGLYDLASDDVTWLAEGPAAKQDLDWSPDGQHLACVFNHEAVTEVALLELAGGAMRTFQVEPGVHAMPRFTRCRASRPLGSAFSSSSTTPAIRTICGRSLSPMAR